MANPIPGSSFGLTETIGNLRGAGGSIDLGTSHLTVVQSASDEFAGSLFGNTGVFTKSGAATLAMGDVSGFSGTLQVTAGRLTLKGASSVPKFTLAGGTFLRFDTATLNLGLGGIQPGTGGTVEYLNAGISNGYLRGPGTHQILAGGSSSFTAVTTFSSTLVKQDGSAELTYFTNGGKFTNNAPLALDGCTNSASGTLTVNNTVTTIDLANNGVVVVNSGGLIDNLYGDLVTGGGGRLTVNAGGTIHLGDTGTLELDGALLVNNGTLDGTLDVNYGSLAKGSGSFGTVNLTDGGRFSPGNSPGMALISNMVFGPGGTYSFELSSAHATPGNGADLLNISGALAISAGTTANSRFTIGIASLNSAAQAAPLTDFDATKAWHFILATAAGGISGFNPAAFVIDSNGFANPLLGGRFQVSQSGNSLMLDFVPLTTYASWAASYSLAGADALPTADPDGDGLTNLLEYAFGSNPKSADVGAGARFCPVTSGGVRYLGLSYQRPYGPNAPQDITYAVQRTEDLANPAAWSMTGLVLDSQSADALLGLETVVVRSTTPMGATPSGHEFLRLMVSQ